MEKVMPTVCPDCEGSSYQIEAVCCGNFLPSGECCTAKYGTSSLVPEQRPCSACGGAGSYLVPAHD